MARRRITEIPAFANDDEARAWIDEHGRDLDLDAFPVEMMTFEVQPRPRRSQRVSLRMEPEMVRRYRELAEERGMGYQTLMLEVLHRWRPPTRTTSSTTPAARTPRTRTPRPSEDR